MTVFCIWSTEKSALYTFPNLRNFREAILRDFRRVFAHVAPVFLDRGIANVETKVCSTVCTPVAGSKFIITHWLLVQRWCMYLVLSTNYVLICMMRFIHLTTSQECCCRSCRAWVLSHARANPSSLLSLKSPSQRWANYREKHLGLMNPFHLSTVDLRVQKASISFVWCCGTGLQIPAFIAREHEFRFLAVSYAHWYLIYCCYA